MIPSTIAHTPTHEGLLPQKKPTLVIFEDRTDDLSRFIETYRAAGFEVTGVPVLGNVDVIIYDPVSKGVLNQAKLTALYEQAPEDSLIRKHIDQLQRFAYAVASPDDVKSVLKAVQPDFILTDRSLSDLPGIETGHKILAIARQVSPTTPRAMHTDGDIGEHDIAMAKAAGHFLAAKDDSAALIHYFKEGPAASQGKAIG